HSYSGGVSNPTSRAYYTTQSQTIVAARAASQLDYDKVQNQIAYQQALQQQIENAKDLKSAMDLNNRIQVESNLINLEILRQAAISNQQQAVTAQGGVNSALTNAKFLTKQ
ncbi:MAG TPA: type IV secretion system protein, partial [Gammaproteobacteria bacterium]|nr:type IV secretion system protein [Gammaproteobacteria bacterium]